MGRRKATGGATHVGDVLPPPPAIPEPPRTEEDQAKKRELARLIKKIGETITQQNLDRAVVLAQMAARRQGPLVDFFEELGRKYYKLADEGPRRAASGLRVIKGGAD